MPVIFPELARTYRPSHVSDLGDSRFPPQDFGYFLGAALSMRLIFRTRLSESEPASLTNRPNLDARRVAA